MEEFPEEKDGFFARVKRLFAGEDIYYEEDENPSPILPPKRKGFLRFISPRDVPVFKRELASFDHQVEETAHKLRQGFIVVVNLEKASEEIARRVVDFMSGVAFGIQGSYEKVGDKVFLFAPPGYTLYE